MLASMASDSLDQSEARAGQLSSLKHPDPITITQQQEQEQEQVPSPRWLESNLWCWGRSQDGQAGE